MNTEERKKISVYNPANHLIKLDDITAIFKKCNIIYVPNNLSLFQLGLTHKSYIIITNPNIEYDYVPNCVELQPKSNERLEFLGDSVLGFTVASYLYDRYPSKAEGFLTTIKSRLVRTESLSRFSLYLGLDRHILISKHVEELGGGRTNKHILEDTFEAFIGATYKDILCDQVSNIGRATQICSEFIIKLIEDTTDFRELMYDNNYKGQLLQFYHKTWGKIHPEYVEISLDGPTNNHIYTMGVKHPKTGEIVGRGTDHKKVVAEQNASKMALDYFTNNPPTVEPHIEPHVEPHIECESTQITHTSNNFLSEQFSDFKN